jgi:hypothetical protein
MSPEDDSSGPLLIASLYENESYFAKLYNFIFQEHNKPIKRKLFSLILYKHNLNYPINYE